MTIDLMRQGMYLAIVLGLCMTAANKENPISAMFDVTAIVFVVSFFTLLR